MAKVSIKLQIEAISILEFQVLNMHFDELLTVEGHSIQDIDHLKTWNWPLRKFLLVIALQTFPTD